MKTLNLAEAKSHLSDLVNQVEDGESFQILRRGKPVAQLAAASPPRKQVDLEWLKSITDNMRLQEKSGGEFVRAMRDGDRY